ncbi:hypothetical protein [Pedobacter sp. AJM]|uniref:hypothetical protein n=1 Tax=Pedobacter sp. AJM TaxID=2003629 RepID=UPI000B4AA2DB|nr:hypothetical protein [Pedobacter sp. AJM]OWK68846.1 hypothetical protein CBW18_19745 [Pedobacter sp. AJM]
MMKNYLNGFNCKSLVYMILFTAFCFPLIGEAQTQESIIHPKIIPPSPEAQSFIKYGEIPVSYSTGTPNIEISIYEINSKKLKLPISLNYHPNIKPSDIASCVGLGWKLNAGGLMTRSIKGRADEAPGGGMLNVGIVTLEDVDNGQASSDLYYKAKNQLEGNYDSSSDNYYYSVGNGLSGGFVYDKNKNLVKTSYSDDKIVRTSVNTFEITDDKGTFYQFNHKENTLENSANWVPGSWWLTKIISSDRTDTISFEYENYPYTYGDIYASQSLVTRECFNGYTGPLNTYASIATSYMSLLKKITFKDGYLNFSYLNDRLDLRASRLKEISIYTNQNTLLKKTVLNHGHFYSGYADNTYNYRLKLTGLTTKNGNDGIEYSHSFQYNEQDILPPYRSPTDNNTFFALNALDYWGYYNGKTQNPNLLPVTPYSHLPAGDRSPDERYAKACILEKIVYPTGGFTTFAYEGNRIGESIGNPISNLLTGGLRISQITTKASPEASPVIKKYEYGNGVSLMPFENNGRYVYTEVYQDCNLNCFGESTTYLSDAIVPLADFNGSPVIYTAVDEYLIGDNNQNLKTSYLYDVEPDQIETIEYPRYSSEYAVKRNWARGNLLSMGVYNLSNGIYKLVRTIENSYTSLATTRIITGTKFCYKVNKSNCNTVYIVGNPVKNSYFYFDEKVDVGIKKIESTATVDYDGQGNPITSSVQNFSYTSSNHLFPTKKSFVNSQGHVVETTIKYPHNYSDISPYNEMINRNMISSPIDEVTTNLNLSKELSHNRTSYDYFQSNLIAPSVFESSYNGGNLTPEKTIANYDESGNPVHIILKNNHSMSYKWGYHNQYPIVECKNAVNGEFFYEGYEDRTDGTTGLAHTGQRYGTGTSIFWTPPNGRSYMISYWYRSNGIWNYYLSSYNGSNYTLTGGDAYDDVMIYPKDAKLTTYTYDPLVGMTSQTDPKGMTSYYEYDNFGRLKWVKDQHGNILKENTYHYKN